MFLPNEMEAMRLARISAGSRAVERLRRGAGTVVVKTAGQGAVAAGGGQVAVARDPGDVVDSTGAGDSFDAGFLVGVPPRAAARGDAWRSGTRAARSPRAASAARDAAHDGRGARSDRRGSVAVIVCLAANPSIDKLFEVDRLVRGDIHRPIGFEQTAGGKGLNVARAAAGARRRRPCRGAVPRPHGQVARGDACRRKACRGSYVWTHGENRASLSVADRETGGLTEFYEHGSEVPSSAWPELAHATAALFGDANLAHHLRIDPAGIARLRLSRPRGRGA